jgi:HD-GYP domain-containing protein (c-di-GMP phosphodiesterase class II)
VRLVATSRLAVGTRLARDVVSGRPNEAPLLRVGTQVDAGMRDALLRAGIHGVYVDDELGADIDVVEPISAETRRVATDRLSRALGEVGSAGGGELPAASVAGLEDIALGIADELTGYDDAALALVDLAAADAYTLQHSIDVTVVGLLVAKRVFRDHGWVDARGNRSFDRIEQRLSRFGVGLLLHDIGKITIPQHVLSKPESLTEEEWKLVKGHPRAGVELLSSDLISAHVKGVVRSHHERWDGSGYPDGRVGDKISQLARIAAVADVFDAVTSERPYRPAQPTHVGVDVVVSGAGTSFDPEVVASFRRVVAPYPPGSEMTLTDGRRAVVVAVKPYAFDLPVVRVATDPDGSPARPRDIDLMLNPELAPRPAAAA